MRSSRRKGIKTRSSKFQKAGQPTVAGLPSVNPTFTVNLEIVTPAQQLAERNKAYKFFSL